MAHPARKKPGGASHKDTKARKNVWCIHAVVAIFTTYTKSDFTAGTQHFGVRFPDVCLASQIKFQVSRPGG